MAGYFVLKKSGDQVMFNLKAGSHETSQTIGKSEMYSSTSAMEGGIASCRTKGSTKEVKDET